MTSILKWLLGSRIGELSRHDDWRLEFVAGHGNYIKLAVLLVLAGMVYLTVRSYRREGDTPRRTKIVLASLRIAVIVLVLVILFQPAAVLRVTRTLHSTLVVLIDDSLSMSFKDRYGDGEQRRAVTALLQGAARAKPGGASSRPGAAASQPTEPEALTRKNLVALALDRPNGALAALVRDHPLVMMGFSSARPGQEEYVRALGRFDVAEPGAEGIDGGISKAMDALTASGHETNIGRAIRDALKKLEGRRLAGIVVISDGQVTAQTAPLTGAKEYAAQRGAPLYSVCVGDPSPPKELRMVGLQAPRQVRRGQRAAFTATLAHRNLAGRTITVRVQHRPADGQQWTNTGVAQTVKLQTSSEVSDRRTPATVQTVTLDVEPKELGEFVFRAVVDAPFEQHDPERNTAETLVRVSDSRVNVLLISGDAGWEFQYLRNYLLRTPDLYRLSVWQQNLDKEIDQVASSGMRLARLPTKLAELIGSPDGKPHPGYDVVILYDPQPGGGLDGAFLERLRTFVKRHGKGLCYIAGNKHSDWLLPAQGPHRPLADMLPVVLSPNRLDIVQRIGARRPQPWPIRPSAFGVDHPLTRLGTSVEETGKIWDVLPGVYWTHPVRKAKPTARVLAVNSNPLRRTEQNPPRPEPVVATLVYGAGKSIYVGFDATWRWRFLADGAHHRRFWGNIVGYLATLGARRVILSTGGERLTVGEKTTFRAHAYDREYNPLEAETFSVTLRHVESGRTEELELRPKTPTRKPGSLGPGDDPEPTGQFELDWNAAEVGTFELSAKAEERADSPRIVKRFTVAPPRQEMARREADVATMRTVASRPEYFLPIDRIDRLAELVPPGKRTTVRRIPIELWDTKLSLLLIVTLLTVEWALRKKHNMA